MKAPIPLLVVGLSLATFGGWSGVRAHAAEESKDITRVAIAVSGEPVAYTDQLRENPPAIVIEFRSRNVKAQLEPLVAVNAGILKEIQSDYYPPGRRALKSLTLTLVQPAAYAIAQQANHILIDIETPSGLLPGGRMAIGGGLTILGIEARETLVQRMQAMGEALQQAAPPAAAVIGKPKPVVVMTPVEIPKPVFQPEPQGEPVSKGGRGGFWPGVLLGIGGTLIAVVRWRRRRKAAVAPGEPTAVTPIAQGASGYEQLILKAVQRQGQKMAGSKTIEGLGTVWIIEKEGSRRGLLCLIDGGFFERKVLEQFVDALQQEVLRSGTVYALGAFTAPAQAFAKECGIALIAHEEVLRMVNVELKGPGLEPEAAAHLAKVEGELVQAQERIKALEQQVVELTKQLADKDELYAKLTQEADQLKARSAEVDQRLAAEQEKRTQLEAQIALLEEQLKAQMAAVAEKSQVIQEATEATRATIKAAEAEELKAGQERRQWPRLDLSTRKGKGILVRVTSNDGEPINGEAKNVSAGGACVEFPSGERLDEEFDLKLFFPDRTKPIEAIGKIVWTGRGSRRRMQQLGIALSAINAPDQEAIKQFVEQRTSELVTAERGS